MQIVEYAKAHPWITGAVIVIGGIVFFSLSGFGGSSSSGSTATSRKSDAEIAAEATIAAAQINASAAAQAYAAQAAGVQAGYAYQLQSDQLNAEIARRSLDVQHDLGLAGIDANKTVDLATINAQEHMYVTNSNNQVAVNQIIANASKSKNKTSTIGNVLTAGIGALSAIFSDSRLKQNVQLVGTNPAGLKVIEFNYKGDDRRYKGLVAQDVADKFPEAVTADAKTGYLKVNPWALPKRARSLSIAHHNPTYAKAA